VVFTKPGKFLGWNGVELRIVRQEDYAMCDYSLQLVASRPAKVGDRLVTSTFPYTLTRGLSAVGEPKVAVCLLPGTEVAFETYVKYERAFSVLPYRTLKERVARFCQIQKDRPNIHHDALDFPGGHVVLITRLREGQRLMVLQLPALPLAEIEPDEHKQPSFVD
jgi:hypothetical protein